MIKVHNFYNDLLLYMRYLFDNLIFGPNTIKHYEFNTGNRTLQLDYNTQFEMPMAVLNLQDTQVVNHHPWLILRSGLQNQSIFPVLYNKTKNLSLELQEEEHEIIVNVSINCESQYSAIQYRHRLVSNLPLNKPKELKHFYSFLEIPESFLDPELFDINNDDIINLYLKHNTLTDRPVFCYSVRYEPLIRLDSCSVGLSNSEPRSFPVECTFTLHTGIPMYVQIPFDEYPSVRKNEVFQERNVTVPIIEEYPILDLTFKTSSEHLILPLFINDVGEFKEDYYSDNKHINIIGKVKFKKLFGILKFNFQGENIEVSIEQTYRYDFKIINTIIKGPISGTISNCIISDDDVCGFLFGKYGDKTINQSIRGKITIIKHSWILDSFEYHSKDYSLDNYKILDFGKTADIISTINPKKVQFIPENSKIIAVQLYELDNNKVHNVPVSISINKYGSFIVPVEYNSSISDNKNYFTIYGKFHPKTMDLTFDITNEQIGPDFRLIGLTTNLEFKNIPKYGSKVIEKINFDISSDFINPIAIGNNVRFFKDEFDRININDIKVIRSFLISPNLNPNFFIFDHNIVKFKIEFEYDFNYDQLLKTKNISWKFIINDEIYNDTNNIIILEDRTDDSFPNILVFYLSELNYEKIFKYYSLDNPIYFQLFEQL